MFTIPLTLQEKSFFFWSWRGIYGKDISRINLFLYFFLSFPPNVANFFRDDTHDVHENCLISETPHPLVQLHPKLFFPLDLRHPVSNEPRPPPEPPATLSNKLYGTATAPCMWTNEFKIKTKPSHITFKLTMPSIVQFSTQTMQWYHWKNGFTVWHRSQ